MHRLHHDRPAESGAVPGSPHRQRGCVGVAVHLARREPLLLDVVELVQGPPERAGRHEPRRCVRVRRLEKGGRVHRHDFLLDRGSGPGPNPVHLTTPVPPPDPPIPRVLDLDRSARRRADPPPDGKTQAFMAEFQPGSSVRQTSCMSAGGWRHRLCPRGRHNGEWKGGYRRHTDRCEHLRTPGRQPGIGRIEQHAGSDTDDDPRRDPLRRRGGGQGRRGRHRRGSVPDAFNAVIRNINAQGGINGRKIVPYLVAMNPTGTTAAASACTQLTEDDDIFVAIAPLMPTCYAHNVPVVGAVLPSANGSGVAQDFTATPPDNAYDPLELSVFDKQGVFKGKKVAVFGGNPSEQAGSPACPVGAGQASRSRRHHRDQLAPEGDLPASNSQVQVIAQKFQSDGVNEVVAVGYGSATWAQGLSDIQSTYNPPWVATSESDFSGDVGGNYNPIYLKNVVTSSPLTPPASILEQSWDPEVRCPRSQGLPVQPHQRLQR